MRPSRRLLPLLLIPLASACATADLWVCECWADGFRVGTPTVEAKSADDAIKATEDECTAEMAMPCDCSCTASDEE